MTNDNRTRTSVGPDDTQQLVARAADQPETAQYAADRGVTLAPSSIGHLLRKHGHDGTRDYIDKLGDIMDAASLLGVGCTQALATRRLSLAEGDHRRVIADFTAEHRRRSDRRAIACRVVVPPHTLRDRANAFAGCGCQRCRDRLAAHMQRYIGKMIATPFFRNLDREEARAEANLELIHSIETWPGGNFTGWFAARFTSRVRTIYRSRSTEERETLSLDARDVLADDEGGRIVSLGERIPDRSVSVLTIVLLRERLAEAVLELRRIRAERASEYMDGSLAKRISEILPRPLRLVEPEASVVIPIHLVKRPKMRRKAA
jgi:DNA-directed RNA polymerase specialized sigma24 family protein